MPIDFDIVNPIETTAFVRELPVPKELGLARILPDKLVPNVKAVIDSLAKTNRAAKFRAFDAETPIGKRDTLERKEVKLPPLGQKTPITELETIQLFQLQGMNNNMLLDQIYADVDVNATAVQIRMELARGDVLEDGVVSITDENGLTLEADFELPGSHVQTPGTGWDDHDNADVVGDLQAAMDVYNDDGGIPGKILMSRTAVRHALRNAELRNLAQMNGIIPATLSLAKLNDVLDSEGLPPIQVYNGRFDVDGTTTRAIADSKVLMLPENPEDLGYTAWGITAEAIQLAQAQRIALESAPGLVALVTYDDDPVTKWTKVGATGMPILTDPRKLVVIDAF